MLVDCGDILGSALSVVCVGAAVLLCFGQSGWPKTQKKSPVDLLVISELISETGLYL